MSNFVLGLDIGYSNLIAAFGDSDADKPESVMVSPAGAGPAELMPKSLLGGASREQTAKVIVDGEEWVAGVDPEKLQGLSRELHSDYPSSNVYRALFYSALLFSGRDVINTLVTGLPVNQHADVAFRENLANSLKGTHKITPKCTVTVEKVIIVPQPAGAYLNTVYTTEDEDLLDIMSNGRTVIVDPGFFSVDWVTLVGGEIRHQSSGTDHKAVSVILEETALLIESDYGAAPSIEQIEKALRSQQKEIILIGRKVCIAEYLEEAANKVTRAALVPMRTGLREEGTDVDVVLLAGGGAKMYEKAAKDVFPLSRIIMSEDPVLANATGFWFCSKS